MTKTDRFDELKEREEKLMKKIKDERLQRTGTAPANMTVNTNIKTKDEAEEEDKEGEEEEI